MISNLPYWNDTSLFTTDDLFSLPIDITPLTKYNQYSMIYDDINKDEEIFSSAEVNYMFTILLNISRLFTRLIAINHKHYHPVIPHSKSPSRI